MNATSRFVTERELSVVGGRTIGNDLADLNAVARIDDDAVVVARSLVGAGELAQVVVLRSALVQLDGDDVGRNLHDHAGLVGGEHVTGVNGREDLHAGSDERAVAEKQRHRLTLHVGAHERAVSIVVARGTG